MATGTRTIVIPASGRWVETVSGKHVAVLSATGAFKVDLGTGDLPMVAGRRAVGSFTRLVFTDTSGAGNTVEFYAGETSYEVSESTLVTLASGSTVALAAATITSLLGAATRTPGFGTVTNVLSTVFVAAKYLQISNVSGGGIGITVNGETLADTETVEFPMLPGKETYGNITVDCQTLGAGTFKYVSAI